MPAKVEPAVWHLLRQGKNAADYNMALDEALLTLAAEMGRPTLRFYGWSEPAATFGYSQKYVDVEKMTPLRPVVRRPTGGGLVPHDNDWTYSLVFPAGHYWHRLKARESYQRVHRWISAALEKLHLTTALSVASQKEIPGQCFAGAEKDDVLWRGRKIAGAAQRRTGRGLLIQGSVQPPAALRREDWEAAMCEIGQKEFSLDWERIEIAGELRKLTEELRATRYSQKNYNEKR
ncbi:MAG: lipoyl protein ligase domain-containing protein [Limisphaerales bacterium]